MFERRERKGWRRVIAAFAGGLALFGILLHLLGGQPAHAGDEGVHGQRCRDAGPIALSDDWCGCTWGAVYVDGTAVAGAQITLTMGSRLITRTTALMGIDPFPIYDLHADVISATQGGIAVVSASYAGETISRTIRLAPNIDGEQLLNLVFPQTRAWQTWSETASSRGLAISGTSLWVGTPAGPIQWNTLTGLSTTHATGLLSPSVQSLAIAPNGHVFVGTPSGVSRFDGTTWLPQSPGVPGTATRALAIAPNGEVWAGINDAAQGGQGGLSRFDGVAWQPQPDFNGGLANSVTALAFDGAGALWVGTDDAGVSRWDGTTWHTYRTANGLASNTVSGIAVEPGAVWISTLSYLTPGGTFGGVSRYDLTQQTWTTYTHASGLASDNVTGVAIDSAGRKWFGTASNGISRFDGHTWATFTISDGLVSDAIRTLLAGSDGTVWAGSAAGVARWAGGLPGLPPVATPPRVGWSGAGDVLFSAMGADQDENGATLRAYEWWSDRIGALGSEITFTVPIKAMPFGPQTISVRAQDDEGEWSAPVTTTLNIWPTHMPMLFRP